MTDRRTGSVGATVDLKNTTPNNRRTGSVGVFVDLKNTASNNRQIGGVGVLVDLKIVPPPIDVTRSIAQATAVALEYEVEFGGTTYPITVSAGQGIAVECQIRLTGSLTVALAQATEAVLFGRLQLVRVVTATQSSLPTLSTRSVLSLVLATAQPQIVSSAVRRGYQRVLTAAQAQAVDLLKTLRVMRRTTGTNRVETSVRLGRLVGRVLRVGQPTQVRLLQQVRLERALTQSQATGMSGLPVELQVVSAVQARSLDLGRDVFLTRLLEQAQALVLQRDLVLERTAVQPTLAMLARAEDLTRAVEQGTAVSVELLNVTPRYDILVTTSVSQQVALGISDTGAPAHRFEVDARRSEFVVGQRSSQFAVPSRRARFRVGVR